MSESARESQKVKREKREKREQFFNVQKKKAKKSEGTRLEIFSKFSSERTPKNHFTLSQHVIGFIYMVKFSHHRHFCVTKHSIQHLWHCERTARFIMLEGDFGTRKCQQG